ncbi:MAG: ATP synthase F0 subunit B [bacterium]|nr:ATP synthase F0 subunit B [bacterium]
MSYYDDPLAAGVGDPPEPPLVASPDEPSPFDAIAGGGQEVVEDVEAALGDLERYVSGARGSSLSSQVRLDRDHLLELIRIARARLPVALRSARWLIKERNDYLAKARRDAEEIIDDVKAEAARMVQRAEVVKQAEARARRIIEAAEEQARRQRLELEDYCDEQLARFESAIEGALANVREGRRKLQRSPPPPPAAETPAYESDPLFFNQDEV